MKGTFTSVWDGGIEVSTPAELDVLTGEITTESVDINGLDELEREYFTDELGDEYEVCPECHCHTMKAFLVQGVENFVDENKVCSDPDCING